MPTDQLLDDSDMDRSLRDLLPPMPRSAGWEARQRETLLTFIATGDIRERRAPAVSDAPLVPLRPSGADRTRSRGVVVLGMAAAAVLLIAGLVIAPRWVGPEDGSSGPRAAPVATVIGMDVDRFPVAPSTDEVVAFVMPQNSNDWPRRSSAFVGRVDPAGVITEPIVIEVFDDDECARNGCLVLDRIELEGRVATVYDVGAGPDFQIRSLVIPGTPGTPTVTLTGADPVGFVSAIGVSPVRLLPDTDDGELAFEVAELPDGYRVVIGPTPYVRGLYQAGLALAGPGGAGAQVAVIVQPNSELLQLGRLGPIEPVDLGGVTGWTYDLGEGSPVIWQVSPTTWASVTGAPNRDAAVEIARSLRFTDRATWETMYDVSTGVDELPAIPVATGDVPPASVPPMIDDGLAQVACTVIGVSPNNFDRRVEIDCGSEDGLRVGMPVVGADRLVGRITTVALDTSVVMLLDDPLFSVEVTVGTGSEAVSGVLRGAGGDRLPQVTLGASDQASRPALGDVVATAGGSTSLAPAGIPIGPVAHVDGSGRIVEVDAIVEPGSTALTVVLFEPDRWSGV